MSGPTSKLETVRLSLSAFNQTDNSKIVSLANNYELAKNLGRMPYPYGKDDAAFFLTHIVTAEATWKVSLKETGEMIGTIGLRPIIKNTVSELGFWYGQVFWGYGYATEAAKAVIEHAFNDLNLTKIIAGHFVANPASGKVLKKLGFLQIGRSPRECMAQNKMLAHVELELTAHETL